MSPSPPILPTLHPLSASHWRRLYTAVGHQIHPWGPSHGELLCLTQQRLFWTKKDAQLIHTMSNPRNVSKKIPGAKIDANWVVSQSREAASQVKSSPKALLLYKNASQCLLTPSLRSPGIVWMREGSMVIQYAIFFERCRLNNFRPSFIETWKNLQLNICARQGKPL